MGSHMWLVIGKHDVIHKPEVHNVLQRRQKRTDPRPHATDCGNLVKFGNRVGEICSLTDIPQSETLNIDIPITRHVLGLI